MCVQLAAHTHVDVGWSVCFNVSWHWYLCTRTITVVRSYKHEIEIKKHTVVGRIFASENNMRSRKQFQCPFPPSQCWDIMIERFCFVGGAFDRQKFRKWKYRSSFQHCVGGKGWNSLPLLHTWTTAHNARCRYYFHLRQFCRQPLEIKLKFICF